MATIAPTTLNGAAVRARAVMYAAMHWWDKPLDELEWPEEQCRLLIEALCLAAGVPVIPSLPRLPGAPQGVALH
jgi:hypothetical protein